MTPSPYRYRLWGTALFVALLMGVAATSCYTLRRGPSPRTAPPPTRTLRILAVNDMHAAVDNMPRFAFIVDSLRRLYPDLLLLSAGDNLTGNPVSDQHATPGLPVIELMNHLRFDLSAVGNHEFDVGIEGFRTLMKQAHFDFICANVQQAPGVDLPILPYKIIGHTPTGLRIAFTSSLVLNDGGIPDSHPKNLNGLTFSPAIETATSYAYLKDQADLLIYLTHLGATNDIALAHALPAGRADLIIGGHSHTRIDRRELHHGIMVTQAQSKLRYASWISLTVQPDGSVQPDMELIAINPKGNTDPSVAQMVARYNNNPALHEQITTATAPFSSGEMVGYLMMDALRQGAAADIALINPGGVRIDRLPAGPISVRQVYLMDPFGNEVIKYTLSGAELKALVKAAYAFEAGKPLYASDGHITYYVSKEEQRLESVEIHDEHGHLFEDDKKYIVAMNSYMASVYKYSHRDPGQSLNITTADNMILYLRQQPEIPSYQGIARFKFIYR